MKVRAFFVLPNPLFELISERPMDTTKKPYVSVGHLSADEKLPWFCVKDKIMWLFLDISCHIVDWKLFWVSENGFEGCCWIAPQSTGNWRFGHLDPGSKWGYSSILHLSRTTHCFFWDLKFPKCNVMLWKDDMRLKIWGPTVSARVDVKSWTPLSGTHLGACQQSLIYRDERVRCGCWPNANSN